MPKKLRGLDQHVGGLKNVRVERKNKRKKCTWLLNK
jgi:hypothetical protein